MPMNRVTEYLDEHRVPYEVLHHEGDCTAQEAAADTHTPGRAFAKTVLIGMPRGHAMAVVPALCKLDLEKVRQGVGTRRLALADEPTMDQLCPDCEVGAEPPFGNLYGLPVYVDPTLTRDEYITFNGGTHQDAIRMKYSDYERLVHPAIMDMVES